MFIFGEYEGFLICCCYFFSLVACLRAKILYFGLAEVVPTDFYTPLAVA